MASSVKLDIQEDGSCACFPFVPEFVAKIQNLSIHDPLFKMFTVPLLMDFADGIEMRCCSALSEQSGSTRL